MKNTDIRKSLFYSSIFIFCYFLFLVINFHIIRSRAFIIGFFQELLTIPLLLVQPFLLYTVFQNWHNEKYRFNSISAWTAIILLVTFVYTYGSFIFSRL